MTMTQKTGNSQVDNLPIINIIITFQSSTFLAKYEAISLFNMSQKSNAGGV